MILYILPHIHAAAWEPGESESAAKKRITIRFFDAENNPAEGTVIINGKSYLCCKNEDNVPVDALKEGINSCVAIVSNRQYDAGAIVRTKNKITGKDSTKDRSLLNAMKCAESAYASYKAVEERIKKLEILSCGVDLLDLKTEE